jgi:alpha-beta hydrolase superfamily lysophospholipase
LDDGAVVAGHPAGAAILVNALAEQPPERGLAAIVLIAAPFVGEGGWPSDEFELTSELSARLPPGVPVHVFHGLRDDTPAFACGPVCPGDPAGAGAPTARAGSPAEQRPERGG